MADIVISGNTSGAVTLRAPDVSGTTLLTLPTTSGTIVTTAGATSLTTSGNLTFTGTGNRIIGDFSNATIANRVMFQTSTTNSATNIYAIPNGTATTSTFSVTNSSDPGNASITQLAQTLTEARLQNVSTGTGTLLPLTFWTNNAERLRIDTSGNVGIGTSSPLQKLSVTDASTSAIEILSTGATAQLMLGSSGTNPAYINYNRTGAGSLAFYDTNAASERMRIDSSGNVGIGTTNILKRLSVEDTNASTTTTTGISITNFSATGNSRAGITFRNFDNYGSAIWSPRTGSTAGELVFGTKLDTGNIGETDITERMRITRSGNVLIGITSGGAKLYVRDDGTAGPTSVLDCSNANFAGIALEIGVNRGTTNNSYWFIRAAQSGIAYRFNVADSGNVTNTNGSYGAISDARLKENIVDATPKLDKVNQLKVRNFNFKGDDLKQIGFIAQELEEVFPSMVETAIDCDKEGNDLGTTTKSIKTSVLVPILVKAIQEQQTMIQELKARIDVLEGAK